MKLQEILEIMKSLDDYALIRSTDPKVFVGACVGYELNDKFYEVSRGCNCNYDYNERLLGKTYREFLFGSKDTKYRPWDKIIHAEENAIANSKSEGYNIAIVTRYPCDKCAQLLVYKGIKTVYYGRSTEISDYAKYLFEKSGVKAIHIEEYNLDETESAKKIKDSLEEHKNYIRGLK